MKRSAEEAEAGDVLPADEARALAIQMATARICEGAKAELDQALGTHIYTKQNY